MISLILMALAGICKAVMDAVQFHYPFNPDNAFLNPAISWKNKYKNLDPKQGDKFLGSSTVFVAFTDFWHLMGMINSFLIVAAIVLYSPITPIKIKVLSLLVDFLIIKIAHQSFFHAFYTWVFVKGKK
jgi:hypothetical protein